MLEVIGDRVLIKPKPLKTKHKIEGTDIEIDINYGSEEKIMKMASQEGTVVGIGPAAWEDYKEPWCKVGDNVLFAQYSGKFVTDPETNEDFMVINDIDIQVIIK